MERTATLFLGAGINANLRDIDNEPFPLGQGLSKWICKDVLDSPDLETSLQESSEIAIHKYGKASLNDYIYKRFAKYTPGVAHLALVQLPWDIIYTTNYDTLVERAASTPGVPVAGHILPVVSAKDDVSKFREGDIPYYKIHGDIDSANTSEGRLILTREDYRYYEQYRRPLFARLQRELLRRTFVFIGYSLVDDNFRAILNDCREELSKTALPLSYAVMHDFTPVQEAFWRDKYNIQLLKSDGGLFLERLKEHWVLQQLSVVPFAERKAREYLQIESDTFFRRVGESYYRIVAADCTGSSDAGAFFNGAEPSWAVIRDDIPPKRDVFDPLMEAIFDDLIDPKRPQNVYLVTGAAGTGKSTLVRSLAFYIAREYGDDSVVLGHIPDTPLDASTLKPLVSTDKFQRIILILDHAAEVAVQLERFLVDAKQSGVPVTVVAEERRNQWNYAVAHRHFRSSAAEFELGALSDSEIEQILDALASNDSLGKLTGMARKYQIEHFKEVSEKELIVALRELTTGTSFDQIIRDEYNKIPTEMAKEAYKYVASVGQFDFAVRYETLVRVLGVKFDELREQIFTPTKGVLLSSEAIGYSRHNEGFRLRARHPIFASVVFALVAPDDKAKFEILNKLFTQLDSGYVEDTRLLSQITRRRDIVGIFESPAVKRSLYERLEVILPGDPYVLQHRSIVERDLRNPDLALHYAQRAVNAEPTNSVFQNTLGYALELSARFSTDPFRVNSMLTEASKLFSEAIRRNPEDSFGYTGQAQVLRQRADRAREKGNVEDAKVIVAQIVSLLEEGYEETDGDNIIASQLAEQRSVFGNVEEAIAILEVGLKRNPTDTRLRDLWVRLETDLKHYDKALKLAQEGVKFDPTSWRLQRHIARLLRRQNASTNAVKGHYDAAIRHNRSDVHLLVEYGAFLFQSGIYNEAATAFSSASQLPISSREKAYIREWWYDAPSTGATKRTFQGRVRRVSGASAVIVAVPENFEVVFWRERLDSLRIREGSQVRFTIGFSARGAIAHVTS